MTAGIQRGRRVAVIGAHGRIATAAGARLVTEGHDVTGYARRRADGGTPAHPFPVRTLDIDDPARLTDALTGFDTVLYAVGAHHGAVEIMTALEVFEINALAAQRAALAAHLGGARQFIYLSSTAAMAAGENDGAAQGAYVRSKALAERTLPRCFPGALTILRLGWVIDPTDEVARRQLWPAEGRQVIVGQLPVPMVALDDVARAIATLTRHDGPELLGIVDLVGGCPSQRALYDLVERLSDRRMRVTDVGTIDRMTRLASLRRESAEPPTWLTQSVPTCAVDWATYGLPLRSWQDCVHLLRDVEPSADGS
ncbi:MAG TPA: NAD(P)H-binding protein [Pseudonocardiaceae bacterium]|nr:NAD(P)H-binding protein [Pseudonocardiaceae bacterium]